MPSRPGESEGYAENARQSGPQSPTDALAGCAAFGIVVAEGDWRRPLFGGYASSRDFFEAVREASREAERTRLTLMRMEATEGVRAQGYEVTGRSGHRADATDRTDARVDYEARMDGRIREDYELLDLACRVLYGNDSGKGGLDLLMGSAVADCMSFRYVDARPWSEVSALTGYSERQCMRLCEQGLDAADFYGMANCVGGEGLAT